MKRIQLQQDLPLMPRRVALLPPEDPLHREPGDRIMDVVGRREEEVKLRVSKKVAERVLADPEGAILFLDEEAKRLKDDDRFIFGTHDPHPATVTPWFTDRPRITGLYEVKQKSARYNDKRTPLRMWYQASHNVWYLTPDAAAIPHLNFMLSHFWRGLAKPALGGYGYPLRNAKGRAVMAELA